MKCPTAAAAVAAAVFAFAAAPVQAQSWTPLGANASASVAYRSIGPSPANAAHVRVVVRGEFTAAREVGGMQARTQQNVYDIDCSTRRARRMQTIISTEPGLGGQQRKEDYTDAPWRTPTAGDTVSMQVVTLTCGAAAAS